MFFTSLVIYYEQINNCEVTDRPLADHSGTFVIADSGAQGSIPSCAFQQTQHVFFDVTTS